MAEGLLDGALFLSRLTNPLDDYISAPGHSAKQQLFYAGKMAAEGTVDYAKRAARDPTLVQKDLDRAGQRISRDLNPMATPMADTAVGELRRLNDIGANQGELAFDVGTVAVGAPEIKVLATVGRMSKEARLAKYARQGLGPREAEYLTKPYVGQGSHYFSKKFVKDHFGDSPIVRYLRDSPLNRSVPRGATQGDFYEYHYTVDPQMHGARLPNWATPRGWSGKRMGLKKFGPIGRAVLGAPDAYYSTVGAGAGGAGWALEDLQTREDE